ncbi:hypothetical protein [Roseibium aggregatum]|uniref:Uncharacterized protein n=1 Tax=Roseibium aggregatum TaxID=187304 RepID=A0A939EDP2_9HYPH|nr:hypothetical protein [Roseibium aggregatum]MBN9671255.1 hypothetical protein [Roseibium aggregatum]
MAKPFPAVPRSRTERRCSFLKKTASLFRRWLTPFLPRRKRRRIPDDLLHDVLPDTALRAREELHRQGAPSSRDLNDR